MQQKQVIMTFNKFYLTQHPVTSAYTHSYIYMHISMYVHRMLEIQLFPYFQKSGISGNVDILKVWNLGKHRNPGSMMIRKPRAQK